jgi:hypothetical protein
MVVLAWSSTGLLPAVQCGGIVGLLLQGQVGGVLCGAMVRCPPLVNLAPFIWKAFLCFGIGTSCWVRAIGRQGTR